MQTISEIGGIGMIFYFSATGNSKYVAESVAKELSTCTVDIVKCIDDNSFEYNFEENEAVGIVAPTYFWGIPKNVKEFLTKVAMQGHIYLFYISTYGTTTGQSGNMADKFLKESGQHIDAMFSIRMPDVWTPHFDLSDKEKVKARNNSAEAEIVEVINKVKRRVAGNHMRHKMPMFAARISYSMYGNQSKTSHFVLEDSCVGCGYCAKKCPANAIEMKENKPVWVKKQCIMCLGCLHRCPKFAIQYGKNTKKHGQYLNPNTKV